MRSYRCFFLDEAGHIKKAEIVESEREEDALLAAMKLVDPEAGISAIELWQSARKLFPRTRDHADIKEIMRFLRAAGLAVSEDPSALH
jgi:hypothetical protein